MGKKDQRVDAYIEKAEEFAIPILQHLRKLIHETCPEVAETWKWSFPNFMYKGAILCSMAGFKKHCAFSFWKASIMQDNDKILTLMDRASMGHLGKIERMEDLPADKVLVKYIKAAMKLNEDDVKLPARAKVSDKVKAELTVPDYFIEVLNKHKKAKETFEAFSYSHKKEYLEWIMDAKTEVTRDKRVQQTLEWLTEGKKRNWKYEKC